ncbi:MAG: Stp1/IreP family PP2C-type Ser/Thr phosphatase [Lachnospiraceae bacterium]|nr:Stp1/IreP family PP2C-type Ser/Thr phosphatase [Lachnospiraceae bacterium]
MKTFSLTDVGMKRKINQDYVFTSEEPVGNLPNLFIVADGMGGHKAGDYASRRSTEIIVESVKSSTQTSPIRIIREAVEAANAHIHEEAAQTSELYGMGTTCVVATVSEDTLYVGNVGDSRLYLIDRDITQITKDHSLVEEMVRVGQIDRVSARTHPEKNIITRAVGAGEEIKVDFFDVHLKEGDIILMCSDGLSNMVEDEDIRMITAASPDLAEMAQRLVNEANNRGGKDNIAVVVIDPFGK